MFAWLLEFYKALPIWIQQSPAWSIGIVAFALFMHGDLVFKGSVDALRAADHQLLLEVMSSREEYKKQAWNCTNTVVERAQQSAKVNDEATKKAEPQTAPSKKPVIATVQLPVTPLTADEKKAVQKPKDAEVETLNDTLKASQKVLEKNDLKQAQVTTAKKPE